MLIGACNPDACPIPLLFSAFSYPANSTTIRAKRAVLTVNPLQLFSMAEWPWDVHSLLFDVEQVETVKIFLRFGSEWYS